jgi:hypothetical protein
MAESDKHSDPTPDYVRDIRIFDDEPWAVRGPVDELIDLQQRAFASDRAGDYTQFGRVTMQMSGIEHSIGNHSEAAVYATEAAGAFMTAGNAGEAIGAQATLAKEHRTLLSPNLALGTLKDIIELRAQMSGGMKEGHWVLDADMNPVLRLARSFTATYLASKLVGPVELDDPEYPSVYLPKGPRPSSDASEELLNTLGRIQELPIGVMATNEMAGLLWHLQALHKDLGHRRLNVPGSERGDAKYTATLQAEASFRLMLKSEPEAQKMLAEFKGAALASIIEELIARSP